MSFDISKLTKYVKLPAFLQFLGMFLCLGMLLAMKVSGLGHVEKVVAYTAIGIAFAGFLYDKIYVALILTLLLVVAPVMRAQASPSVLLTWDASTSSIPTNPGNYGVYRAVSTAGACGAFTRIAVLPGLTFTDAKVVGGVSYCYYITFIYTPSGTAASVETAFADLDLTDQITVGPIPAPVTLPPPAPKANSPKNLVGTIQ